MKSNNTISVGEDITVRTSAIIAGLGLLLIAVIAPIANFSILHRLVVPDDAGKTFANIAASEGQFRIGIILFLVTAILDIIVAWALYVFLKPGNSSISLLAAWFRIVYAAMLVIVSCYLINVVQLIRGAGFLGAFDSDQLHAQVMLSIENFTNGWNFTLAIFGVHLLLLGYLLFRAGYMKKSLGILVLIAGLGYMADGVGKVPTSNYTINISGFTFIGEVVLILWLLTGGRKIYETNMQS
jgi:hypothetical protein